ncbi:MAG: pilus assembly protein TadG-related protein [Aeromicrobium erythreum]
MRELIRRPRRDERGTTAIVIGLSIAVLLAGLGMSIDIGNTEYQRNQAQDAVDAAAKKVAYLCIKTPSGCTAAGVTTQAQSLVDDQLGSDTAPVTATLSGSSVKVSFSKNVATPLLSFVGVDRKEVGARATATWNNYPTVGTPVLPLGVSYCTWKNSSANAGTATESATSNRISIRTDFLQSLRNMLAPILSSLSVFRLDSIMNLLGTSQTDTCTDTDGTQLLTFKGGLWLTGEHVVTGLLSGTFQDLGSCTVKVGSDLNTFLGGVESAVAMPTSCAARFGPGKQVDVGKTILLPIYKPQSTLQNKLGFKLSACAGFGSAIGGLTCLEVPPKIGVKIVGYAPFKVTGWRYPNTPSGYEDASVGCPTSSWSLNPYNLVNQTFTLIEKLLNTVSSLLSSLLGIGQLTVSLACNGLQGYFTKSGARDPNFSYSPGGANFGAAAAKLTE